MVLVWVFDEDWVEFSELPDVNTYTCTIYSVLYISNTQQCGTPENADKIPRT